MALTLHREKLLKMVGLMSFGSAAKEIDTRADIESRNKIRAIPKRIILRIVRELHWRHFIQHRFDKIIPYSKYSLPDGVYINDELARKNDSFIRTFE